MCGIFGIVSKNAERKIDLMAVKKMSNCLAHRGPDGEGVHSFGQCVLGHRRLSIVDLSTGDQPMFSAGGKLGIVFNGEIFGYKALRDKLVDYSFKTVSDTEVILALYERYGEKMMSQLPGQFAFAIWDDRHKRLFCARDRFGEKPFYYAIGNNGEFIFASEMKAILETGLVAPRIRKQSVVHFLQRLYIDPHHTIYENIFTLPPANLLVLEGGRLRLERYWNFPEINEKIALNDAIPEFKRLFYKAVEDQLVADVPVGAFLSGGLDSSTVVAVASEFKKNLKTFSFGFRDSINELPYADAVAKKYGTDHTELWDDGESLGELLLKMGDIYDEPFADSSNIPTYLLSKLAKKYTTVALTGDGGDELLGGYGGYELFVQMKNGKNPKILGNQAIYLLARVLAKFPGFGRNILYRSLGARYASEFGSIIKAREEQDKVFSDKDVLGLGLGKITGDGYAPEWRQNDSVDDAMRMDLEMYMPGDILTKTDRAAMANGLELRAPFLDVEFASFCISLPGRLKIHEDSDKYILRKALGGLWPDSIRSRRKQGFGAPVRKWLGDPSIDSLIRRYLGDKNKKVFEILPYGATQKFVDKRNYQTWALLVLAIWAEKWNFKYEGR